MIFQIPQIDKSIKDLIKDEEGSVPRSRLVTIGSMIILMGLLTSIDAYAGHSSHRSHSSHSSHTSHSSSSYHRSHVSHTSHTSSTHGSHSNSHGSHASHSSHINSNTNSFHLNSGLVDIPGTSEIPEIQNPESNNFEVSVPDFITGVQTVYDSDETKDPKLNK